MIIFDIETGPLPLAEIEAVMPEFTAPGNLKDPAKIESAIAEKKAEFIERAALSPLTGEILAIGYLDNKAPKIDYSDELGHEAELIERFFSLAMSKQTMIGFNSHSFDIPFIVRRAWRYGLRVPRQLLQRYLPDEFIDLMKVWMLGNYDQKISLNSLAKYFMVGEKTGDAKDFAKYYREDRAKATEYLTQDLKMTFECAKRMGVIH